MCRNKAPRRGPAQEHHLPVVLAACLLAFSAAAVRAAPRPGSHAPTRITYGDYVNVRFRYAVVYPNRVLYPQGEPDNGDGQKFMSAHADAVLTVFGRYNALDESLESLYDEAARGGLPDHPKRVVTYRIFKKDWFVISGHDGSQIFYEKTLMNKDVIRSLDFVYPEQRKSFFDPIAARIAKSFRRLP